MARFLAAVLTAALSLTLIMSLSNPASAAAAKTTLTLGLSTSLVDSGGSVKLTATLKRGSVAVKQAPVQLQKRRAGTTKWYAAGSGRTGSSGRFAVTVKNATRNLEIRAVYAGTRTSKGPVSSIKRIRVRQKATITKTSATTAVKGANIYLKGTVTPGLVGLRVNMEKKVGTTWVRVSSGTVATAKTFSLKAKAGDAGRANYRVRIPATKATLAANSAASGFAILQWFGLEDIEPDPFRQGNPNTRPLLTGDLSILGVKHRSQIGSVFTSDRFMKVSYRSWHLGAKCARFSATAGFDDRKYVGHPTGYAAFDADKMEMGETEHYRRLSPLVSQTFNVELRGSQTIRLGFSNASVVDDGSWGVAGFGRPQVLCSGRP